MPFQKQDEKPLYIVGIGASAGGLEALQKFFQNFEPTYQFSFVIVQHLAPDHETLMPELLSKCSPVPVKQVTDKTRVEPGHVYIIPPNATLTIKNSILGISKPAEARGHRTPIDSFFVSLAQDHGERAVCVVLSGTGSDGTLGLKAIKESGGLTIAQSPGSAKYDSMPRNAIASSMVDFVLPVEEIPKALQNFVSHLGDAVPGQTKLQTEAAAHLGRICTVLRRKTGHDFSEYKQNTLIRRIQRRMALRQMSTGHEYLEYLKTDNCEIDSLFEDFLIGVTFFFRDPQVFYYVENEIIPKLFTAKNNIDEKLRVWVVGCATGEEAFSLAILLKEYLKKTDSVRTVQIFATDIDENAIERARRARFPVGIAEHVSADRLKRYFTKTDNGYIVTKEIREMCLFSVHDITRDPPFAHIHFLSCRNMLIYLDANLQKKVMPIFNYALKEHGFLLLGSTENVSGYPEGFIEVERKNKIWKCKKTLHRPPVINTSEFPGTQKTLGTSYSIPHSSATHRKSISEEVQKVIVDKVAPPSVVVNKDMDIVFVLGNAERYTKLPSGVISTNLYQMAREELKYDLRTALNRAFKEKSDEIVHDGAQINHDGKKRIIKIQIRRLYENDDNHELFLVSFHDQGAVESNAKNFSKNSSTRENQIIDDLESELKAKTVQLQTTVEEAESVHEELKSSNEELLSMNEELQSTNEELQTSQEELQSVNEELETVNSELHLKIDELDAANSDLQNLLTSIRVATVFLDERLAIKRFTPETNQLFNILDSDIGRPFIDIASGVLDFDIQEQAEHVLNKLEPYEQEVYVKRHDTFFIVRILPYRSVKNVIAGVVLTFTNITKTKKAESELRTANERLVSAMKGGKSGYFDLFFDPQNPHELPEEVFFSAEMKGLIGFGEKELPNQMSKWLDRVHPDDIGQVRKKLQDHIQGCANKSSLEYRIKHKSGEYRWLTTSDPVTRDAEKCPTRWTGIVFDITERKNSEEASAHLAAVVSTSQNAILSKTLDGTITTWNRGAELLYGYSKEEAIGKSIELIIPEDRRGEMEPIYESIRTGKDIPIPPFETERIKKDSSRVPIILNISPIKKDGVTVAISAVAQDISSRKRMEKSLEEYADRLNLAKEAVGIGIHDYNPETGEIYWDEQVRSIWGVDKNIKITFDLFLSGIHPDDREKTTTAVEKAVSPKHGGKYRAEYRVVNQKTNEIRWVEATGKVSFRGQKAIRLVGTVQDITKDRKKAEELITARNEAEAANKTKNVFLANVSHEIRTPLSAISGFTQVILDNCNKLNLNEPDDDYSKSVMEHVREFIELNRSYLRRAKSNSDSLHRIINDLLDISKIEAGKLDIEHKPFNLKILFADVASYFRLHSERKGNTFEFVWDNKISSFFKSDEVRVQQVLQNLLSNAVKYTENGTISLCAKLVKESGKSHTLSFKVSDSGEGMTEEVQKNLFKPFQRGDRVSKKLPGTGLGLYLSRHIAEALNGKLYVEESSPKKGTIAVFEITAEVASQPKFRSKEGHSETLNGIRILVAEDNEDLQLLMKAFLQESGAEVDCADNGLIAVEMFSKNRYDMVLMDISMPEMDGYEAVAKIRANSTAKIIAVTAHAMKGEQVKCLASGFDAYLSKPLTKERLLSQIQRIM